jgi:hypothetical protein
VTTSLVGCMCSFTSLSVWRMTERRLSRYETTYRSIVVVETVMDIQAYLVKINAWLRGLSRTGLKGARRAAAGLAYINDE